MAAVSKRRPSKADLAQALRDGGGNLSGTALRLGCSRTTLYTWIYQLGLDKLAGIVPREDLLAQAAARKAEPPRRPVDDAALTVATMKLPAELWRWARIAAIQRRRGSLGDRHRGPSSCSEPVVDGQRDDPGLVV